jgi:hypothetical protein
VNAKHVFSIPQLNSGAPGTKASNTAQNCVVAMLLPQDVIFVTCMSGIIRLHRRCLNNSLVSVATTGHIQPVSIRIGWHYIDSGLVSAAELCVLSIRFADHVP